MLLEPRIYIINPEITDAEDISILTIEEFIEIAEEQGTVYSLKGFQDEFNSEGISINAYLDSMRIVYVETTDEMFGRDISVANNEDSINEIPIIRQ